MGKGGETVSNEQSNNGKVEVFIDDKFYDIKALKHPGGSVINYYANKSIDATQAFNNFHIRSKSAKILLNSLPHRDATANEIKSIFPIKGQSELMKDFTEFENQLIKEGLFEPSLSHTIYRLTELIVLHFVGFYLLFNGFVPLGILILGIGSGRCGWLMHEGGHYSMFGIIKIDKIFQELIYGNSFFY